MKRIFKIAKLDLKLWFYSPVAWLIITIFLIHCGIRFFDRIEVYQRYIYLGKEFTDLTQIIFTNRSGLFRSIQTTLYFFIPLLTMGLISREYSQGTIKLLYSSPISILEIVAGKFLATMLYGLMLISILLVYCVLANFWIINMDWGIILSGLLGLYLMICAYAAIGIFMSSLTSYQVVAAISTLITLAILNYIGVVWQDIDFIRDITYFLSISGRADQFIVGLITSKNILYFTIVIAIFLGLSFLRLRQSTQSISILFKVFQYIGLILSLLLIGYTVSRPSLIFYYDTTATKQRSLTENSHAIIENFKGKPVKITTYVNLLDYNFHYGLPDQKNVDYSRYDQYTRYIPQLEMDYVYYWNDVPSGTVFRDNPDRTLEEIAKRTAFSRDLDLDMFLSPEKMHQIKDMSNEDYSLVRELKVGDSTATLRIYNDMIKFNTEQEISTAFKTLIYKKPTIAFINGHNERQIYEMGDKQMEFLTTRKQMRYALVNQGFTVDSINVSQPIKDIDILVLADPIIPFSSVEQQNVLDYLDKGSNIIVLTEPNHAKNLSFLLNRLGISINPNYLVNDSKGFSPYMIVSVLSAKAKKLSPLFNDFDSQNIFTTPTVGSIQISKTDFNTLPILEVSGKDIKETDSLLIEEESLDFKTIEKTDSEDKILAAVLERKVNNVSQKVFVSADTDIFSNSEVDRSNIEQSNFQLFQAISNWMTDGEFPVDVSRPKARDNELTVDKKEIKLANIIFVYSIPVLLILFAIAILYRRKSR